MLHHTAASAVLMLQLSQYRATPLPLAGSTFQLLLPAAVSSHPCTTAASPTDAAIARMISTDLAYHVCTLPPPLQSLSWSPLWFQGLARVCVPISISASYSTPDVSPPSVLSPSSSCILSLLICPDQYMYVLASFMT